MKKGIILPGLLFIGLICISGCSSSTGSSSPSLSGSMTGLVALYQSNGNRTNASGVTVSIQGTSLSTTTDSTGKWTINGLSAGTYTIVFTKASYGTMEQQGVQFVGGGLALVSSIEMVQPPTFTVAINAHGYDGDDYIDYTIDGAIGGQGFVLIAVGTDSTVSASDPTKYLYADWNETTDTTGAFYISIPLLYGAGFQSKTTAYAVAYPLNNDGGYEYFASYLDDSTGRQVYPSLGARSNVVPIGIP
jgi:hypothetical protein